MIAEKALLDALEEYLPKQRWFGGSLPIEIESIEVLRNDWPGLVQALVRASSSTYQVLLGLRPVEARDSFLEGKGDAIVGELDSDLGRAIVYDALMDSELALCVLEHTAPGEQAERARLLGADQSNTSVVFDERLIMKLFRRLAEGPNPDVEVTRALAETGFGAVPKPVGEWERGQVHLAVVSEFLAGGVDGFHLALTSLRDLYDCKCAPAEAGGDFGHDAARLGAITAEMHLALRDAFGTSTADTAQWADDMEAQLTRVSHADLDVDAVRSLEDRLRAADGGPAIRIHGDFHLGQTMRTDLGWYVLDFEGEPARPLAERQRPSSALRDVAGMLRSFHYAASVGLREHGGPADEEVLELALAWEQHNRARFLDGYFGVDGIADVLPATEADRQLVLAAFELDKAVYEVGYEASHRPEWVGIPLSAVQRILEETARERRTA